MWIERLGTIGRETTVASRPYSDDDDDDDDDE
jgi:hypothetical protein